MPDAFGGGGEKSKGQFSQPLIRKKKKKMSDVMIHSNSYQ